ncbi:hypothetical protein [uncultured Roseobacter sp.]|uniref:hypothetical protein n=1 Tax=uncultured Roseobacter sp. TaxID=114847 RepID=UPI002621584F|nr:hypothetical protein [uncultured Roseobacter sp.]
MAASDTETWNETRLAGWGKWLRLILSSCLIVLALAAFSFADEDLRVSALGIVIFGGLPAVALWQILRVFRGRVIWNETGIRQDGVFLRGRVCQWSDLTATERSMHERATILVFRRLRRMRLYWAYDAHQELRDLAEGKLNDA